MLFPVWFRLVRVGESQLEEAKAQLAELQNALEQRTADSAQTRQLAEERQSAILALEKELHDLQTHVVPQEQFVPKLLMPVWAPDNDEN